MTGVDQKCYELACYFLPPAAPQKLKRDLAQHIQKEVENWIEEQRRKLERLQ